MPPITVLQSPYFNSVILSIMYKGIDNIYGYSCFPMILFGVHKAVANEHDRADAIKVIEDLESLRK